MITKVDAFLSSMSTRATKATKSSKASKSGKNAVSKSASETAQMRHSYWQKLAKAYK